jgi:hypothetical protein
MQDTFILFFSFVSTLPKVERSKVKREAQIMATRPTNPTIEAEKCAHGSPAMIEGDRAAAVQGYLERHLWRDIASSIENSKQSTRGKSWATIIEK